MTLIRFLRTTYAERLLAALLESFELLGRDLGAAVLMHPAWPQFYAASPPLPGARDAP